MIEFNEPELPLVITESPEYNPADSYHVRKRELAGNIPLDWTDGEGNPWRPCIVLDLQLDGSYLRRPLPEPTPVTDVDIARQYAGAYQAALDIIFLLMSRVSTALVIGKHFTPETVNAEGARFTRYHQPEIEAFKLSGRHPDAGDALYAAVEASAGEFPWLKKEDNILGIFATTLPRNPK